MDLAPLRLGASARFLIDGADVPFLYFADTAWAIVWKGKPAEWETYFERRVAQGFSVVQVNLLPWRWHLTDVEGNLPFVGGDPDRPKEAYFARFDRFLAQASARGLVTCLMILWGGPRPNLPAVRFTTAQAVSFARFVVARYGHHRMIWSLSGDAEYAREIEKWDAVGAAVESTDL
ncbi:MAG: DUF4038 domain-containing protein [Chloroflexi bacterium]|nr:DUF4038 domain-containing protein [Chloroflexota bacterium]